jgi:hypothetical protein
MNERKIDLEFSYTEAEYLRASRILMFRASDVLWRLIGFLAFLTIAFASLPVLFPDFPLWAAVALALLIAASFLYNLLVRLPRQVFRGDAKYRDLYAMTISDQGISVKTKQLDSKLAWSLYTKLIECAGLFILVYGNDLRMMTVLPKRAFTSQKQETVFRELVAQHISAH